MTIRNMTTYRLVTAAYGVDCRLATELKLVLGDAEWVSTAAYDVEGTFPSDFPTYTVEQFNNGEAPRLQAMLRDVLAERFGLALHRETKEIPMYNLVMVKPGRIRLSADQTPPPPLVLPTGPPPPGTPPPEMPRGGYQLGINPAGGQVMLEANSIPIRTVIGFMRNTGRMIVDKVEPRGLYDIPAVTLDVGPFSAAPGAVTVWPEIAQQLGLRLEPTKGPFETIVIDRVQKPSEN
jgi:uncharacterized protein (TIGR03435 family)